MISDVVKEAIYSVNQERDQNSQIEFNNEEILFGVGSKVDSLTLVSLIMDVEMLLSDRGIDVSLTDDDNMSTMEAPFATIGNLILYVESLVK